jgi:hypothetical protein
LFANKSDIKTINCGEVWFGNSANHEAVMTTESNSIQCKNIPTTRANKAEAIEIQYERVNDRISRAAHSKQCRQ